MACRRYTRGRRHAYSLVQKHGARDDGGDLGVAEDNIKIKSMHFCESINLIKLA